MEGGRCGEVGGEMREVSHLAVVEDDDGVGVWEVLCLVGDEDSGGGCEEAVL